MDFAADVFAIRVNSFHRDFSVALHLQIIQNIRDVRTGQRDKTENKKSVPFLPPGGRSKRIRCRSVNEYRLTAEPLKKTRALCERTNRATISDRASFEKKINIISQNTISTRGVRSTTDRILQQT